LAEETNVEHFNINDGPVSAQERQRIEALTNTILDWEIVANDARDDLLAALVRFETACAGRDAAAQQLRQLIDQRHP
jgi:hypothetical protein